MARGPGSNGPCLHPVGPHDRFPLLLPLAFAILPPLTGDAGIMQMMLRPVLAGNTASASGAGPGTTRLGPCRPAHVRVA